MFGRWFYVRVRAAERALAQGRIDDAYAAAQQPDVREHPDAAGLLDELARMLTARARLHRQAGRLADALADLDRVAQLGRLTAEADDLRRQTTAELQRHMTAAAEQRAAYVQAADHLRAGRLETARQALRQVADPEQRAELADALDERVRRVGELLARAGEALARDDVLAAVRTWQDARARFGRTPAADEFGSRLSAALRARIETWHREGRLERLQAARPALSALVPTDPTLSELERLVDLCARAAGQLAARQFDALRETLLRVKAGGGEAPWLNSALGALDGIAEGVGQLLASPLGLFASQGGAAPLDVRPVAPPPVVASAAPRGVTLTRPLLVLVDGGPSFLLTQPDRVRIGRGGSRYPVEVPLPGDVRGHHADILRRGEDYFIAAFGPLTINQRPVQQERLRDGDRVEFGGPVRLTFVRPSPMSASAVLRLSHRCRLPQDVSEVVLLSDTCLIGPDPTCHVRTGDGSGRVVLFERQGTLLGRLAVGPEQAGAAARALALGVPQEFGDVRITVLPYEVGPAPRPDA